ncbi:MAG: hypothetical protein K8U03_09320 [Planctomycetia bacterium]|nr:hypothetical protein [Planctomycetia bacterium]
MKFKDQIVGLGIFIALLAVGFGAGAAFTSFTGHGNLGGTYDACEEGRVYVVSRETVDVIRDVASNEKYYTSCALLHHGDRYLHPPENKPFMIVGGNIVLVELGDSGSRIQAASEEHQRQDAVNTRIRDEVKERVDRLRKQLEERERECPKPTLPATFDRRQDREAFWGPVRFHCHPSVYSSSPFAER